MSQPAGNLSQERIVRSDRADAVLARVRALPAHQRLSAIDQALAAISDTPTTEMVFLRKSLLRLRDATRLATGVVTADQLHRENSPFARMDFRRARLSFRPRVHA